LCFGVETLGCCFNIAHFMRISPARVSSPVITS
jgi:hypothetical protein